MIQAALASAEAATEPTTEGHQNSARRAMYLHVVSHGVPSFMVTS
jgi:hypothetical protein